MSSLIPDEVKQKVEALALPLLANAGLDLVELNIMRQNGGVLVQFYADKPEGGITIQECSDLNKAIVEAIDSDGFLGDAYALEFSSPGLDRPLETSRDFMRNLNRPVRLFLKEKIQGKKELTGRLISADMQQIHVLTKKKQNIVVPLTSIEKGMLVL